MIDACRMKHFIDEGFSAVQIALKFDCSSNYVRKWVKGNLCKEYQQRLMQNGKERFKNNHYRFNRFDAVVEIKL